MYDVVVVGGGFAGSAGALAAAKLGARVVVLEKNEELLGSGLVGGRMRSNARFTGAEEAIAMGAGGLFEACDEAVIHRDVPLPGTVNTCFYDIFKIEPLATRKLLEAGVEIRRQSRIKDVIHDNEGTLHAVVVENGEQVEGKVFIDATGTAGPQGLCIKHGYGCAVCNYRCPTFGPRLSIAGKMGVKEGVGLRPDGRTGGLSQAVLVTKESVSPDLVSELEKTGWLLVPIPPDLGGQSIDIPKAGDDSTLRENLLIGDNGTVKIMYRVFIPIAELRRLEGFERARYYFPVGGGVGNSVRFLVVTPRDNTLLVEGTKNLFCSGEKQGLIVGITEAIMTGTLAGYNATRVAFGLEPVEMPEKTILGQIISVSGEAMKKPGGYSMRFSLLAGGLAARIKEAGLYQTDKTSIQERIAGAGLENFFLRG